jgi:hypothetical protein
MSLITLGVSHVTGDSLEESVNKAFESKPVRKAFESDLAKRAAKPLLKPQKDPSGTPLSPSWAYGSSRTCTSGNSPWTPGRFHAPVIGIASSEHVAASSWPRSRCHGELTMDPW